MIKEKSIARNAIYKVLKQSNSVIIPLIMYPYVSRVLGTTNFGRVSFAESTVSFFITLAMLGIPSFAIREGARVRESRTEIQRFSNEVFSINLAATLLAFVALIITILLIPKFYKEKTLLLIFGCNILATCLGRDWLNTIYEDFSYISLRFVVLHILSLICVLCVVKSEEDFIFFALILAGVNFWGEVVNVFHTRKYANYGIVSLKKCKKHLKPVIYLFGIALAVKVYVGGDITILGLFREDTEVGIYSLASKIYIIVKLIFNAISSVVIPRASLLLGKDDMFRYRKLVLKTKSVIFALLVPAIVGVFSLSSDMMMVLGGEEFAEGYKNLEILSVALFFAVMGNLYSGLILIPFRKEKIFTITTIIAAVSNLVLNVVFIPIFGMFAAAATTVLSECFVFIVCLKYSLLFSDKLELPKIISVLVGSFLTFVICYFIRSIGGNSLLIVIKSIIICVLCYGIFMGLISKMLHIDW